MGTVELAAELRSLAGRVPGYSPPASLARQRAVAAAEAVAAALSADPTLAERQQRGGDVLCAVLRRLGPLARQASVALESERLSAAGASTAHLGLVNPMAMEELDAVSARCAVLARQITSAAWADWDSPQRGLELSVSRLPDAQDLAEIANRLRRAVAPALDLPYPAPEAVRLAALAEQIAPRGQRGSGCAPALAATGRSRPRRRDADVSTAGRPAVSAPAVAACRTRRRIRRCRRVLASWP
jgi:hypothetical protein